MPVHPGLPAAVYPPIHGHAVMVRVRSPYYPDVDVVLVNRRDDSHDRYVTGLVRADDEIPTEWWSGHYFSDLRRAIADLLGR